MKVDQKRFFYPNEWLKFYNSIDEKFQAYYKIAMNTGGRVEEIRSLKVSHIDFERKGLTFYTTKVKSRLKQKRSEPRTIPISTQFGNWLIERIGKFQLQPENTFNIPSTQAIDKFMKKRLRKLGFEFWMDYSSHNIRKTFITYMRLWGIDSAVIASHVGHDVRTMNKNYARSTLLTKNDALVIRKKILGDIIDHYKVDWKIENSNEAIDEEATK